MPTFIKPKNNKPMTLNMNKEIRKELRELKRQGRAASNEFNAATRAIATTRRMLVRDEKAAARIYHKKTDRLFRRQAILEGRLA